MAEYPAPEERREFRDSRLARREFFAEFTALGQEMEAEMGPSPYLCPAGCGRWIPCRHCPEDTQEAGLRAREQVEAAVLATPSLPPNVAHLVRGQWEAWEMDGKPRDEFTEALAGEVLAMAKEAA